MSDLVHFKENINPENYTEIVKILDNFLFTMKLCGHDVYCDVKNDSSSYSGKLHVFQIWSKTNGGRQKTTIVVFKVYLDSTWATKARFYTNVPIEGFYSRKFAHKLKKVGFTAWNLHKGKNHYNYDLYCYESPLQLEQALNVFADYIM